MSFMDLISLCRCPDASPLLRQSPDLGDIAGMAINPALAPASAALQRTGLSPGCVLQWHGMVHRKRIVLVAQYRNRALVFLSGYGNKKPAAIRRCHGSKRMLWNISDGCLAGCGTRGCFRPRGKHQYGNTCHRKKKPIGQWIAPDVPD
jgi:hypothetical protein